ncbi:MAG TPA: deoxyribose-phosphate aldolase [Phycisphaerales bacterium]|nr:deoxyribose-phosphate aldolase [Phycisphaerales bacterium]
MQLPKPVTVDKVMAEQRAASFTRRSIKNEAKRSGLRLAMSMVDLTTLEGKDTPEKVRSLCRKAVDPADGSMRGAEPLPKVAAVCVYPQLVAAAKKELTKLGAAGEVKIAAVATGFPSGQYPLKVRLEDTRRAVDAGADEIDMVISRGAFLAGEHAQIYDEVCATVEACGFRKGVTKKDEGFAHLKVILETGELETLDNARRASDIAIAAMHDCGLTKFRGAGFIKTSTGKVEPAATMPVTLVMLEAIRDHWLKTAKKDGTGGELVGMKPAGGIRAAKSALHYLVMVKETLGEIEDGTYLSPSLFRFGASALVNDLVRQILWLDKGRYAARYDFAEA